MTKEDKNKVIFVGAGPGAVDLITLRGKKALEKADIVVYAGSLVNPDLLDYCKKSCEIYNSATMDLGEIVGVMAEGIKAGKQVVRLHTGDGAIYGSIREQIEELAREDIGYEVIPGVSSFLGAASSLGVEFTVPEISQSLIITRIEGRTPVPPKESLRSFASHQTSMAIFLSVQRIDQVVEELIGGGYPEETPVAVIYKATWPDEKIIKGRLDNICQKVADEGVKKTALIFVGDFIGEDFNYSCLYAKDFSHEYRD